MEHSRRELGPRFSIADLEVHRRSGSIRKGDREIRLPKLTFRLLEALAMRAPEVVSNRELLDELWPDTHIADESLKQRVHLLRRALGAPASGGHYVETVRGWGYRIPFLPVSEGAAVESADPRSAANGHDEVLDRAFGHLERLEWGKAVILLEQVLAADPDLPRAWAYLAWARKWLSWTEGADSALRQALRHLDTASKADRHFVLATAAGFDGSLAGAIDHYELLLEEDPCNFWAMVNLAGCLQLAGRLDPAEALVERLATMRPEDPGALWICGAFLLFCRGDLDRAEQRLARLRQLAPRFPIPIPFLAPGFSLWCDGDLIGARRRFDRVLAGSADLPPVFRLAAMVFDARLHAANGEIDSAVSELQRTLSLVEAGDPWHGWCSVELALQLADAGARDEAAAVLRQLASLGTALMRSQALGWTGVLAARAGDHDRAENAIEKLAAVEWDGGWSWGYPDRPGFDRTHEAFPQLVSAWIDHGEGRIEAAIDGFGRVVELVPAGTDVVPIVGPGPRVLLEADEGAAMALRDAGRHGEAKRIDQRLAENRLAVEIIPRAGAGIARRARTRLSGEEASPTVLQFDSRRR